MISLKYKNDPKRIERFHYDKYSSQPSNQSPTQTRCKKRHHHHHHNQRKNVLTVLIQLCCLWPILFHGVTRSIDVLIRPIHVHALEASFEHAPDKDNANSSIDGPLPQSQNQRDQLTQLHNVITSSPNPQETLEKVAQANNMSSQQLADLLNRNQRDLMAAGGAGAGAGAGGASAAGSALPLRSAMQRLFVTLMVFMERMVKSHPRPTMFLASMTLLYFYIRIMTPRNGVILPNTAAAFYSSSSSPLSVTTLFPPPSSYLRQYVQSNTFRSFLNHQDDDDGGKDQNNKRKTKHKKASSSSSTPLYQHWTKKEDHDDSYDDEETTSSTTCMIHSLTKTQKKTFAMVATARQNLPFELLLPEDDMIYQNPNQQQQTPSSSSLKSTTTPRNHHSTKQGRAAKTQGNHDHDDDHDNCQIDNEEQSAWNDAILLAFASARTILSSGRITEYVPEPSNRLRMYPTSYFSLSSSSSNAKGMAMILKSMGHYGRYGIQPLRLVHDETQLPRNHNENEDQDQDQDQDSNESKKSIMIYSTPTHGNHYSFFHGELVLTVKTIPREEEGNGENGVQITAMLLVPKGGRHLSHSLTKQFLTMLVHSIATTAMTEARKTLSRKRQSLTYRNSAQYRAKEKRHLQHVTMEKMEEMAKDRRRRWHRMNPDAGHYRPSGIRMRSPNNC